jgi:mono/diheme cytochrome c family protein
VKTVRRARILLVAGLLAASGAAELPLRGAPAAAGPPHGSARGLHGFAALAEGRVGTAVADTISVLDGVYTAEQARRGRQVFERECVLCHGPREFSDRGFQLVWGDRPVGSLYTQIRTSMPLDNPGSLTPAEYASVVAYILQLNGYPAGENALSAEPDSLSRIRMVRRPE